jgi:hypothetical protein
MFTPDSDPKTIVAVLIDSPIVSEEEKTNSFRPLQKSIEHYPAPIDFTDSIKQELPFRYIERLWYSMGEDFRNQYRMTVTDETTREVGFKSAEDIFEGKDKMKDLSWILGEWWMDAGSSERIGQSEESSGPAGVLGNKDDEDENDGFAGDFVKNIRAKRSLWG